MKQNLTKIKVAFVVIATVMLASCSSKFEKTASGVAYKISHGSGKDKIKQGQIVKFYLEYKVTANGKDSTIRTSFGKMPEYVQFDTAAFAKQFPKHHYTELLSKLSAGDKVEFVLNIDSLKNTKQIPDYDNLFKKGGTVKAKMEIVKVFATKNDVQPDYSAEMEKEMARTAKDREKEMK